ncbi:putative AP-1 complex subunit mu-2-like [Capsicum annuum]|uniref:Uncharacterized protein n=1 Tax=Capsicum annuum TaxID=4072 RepID=A0A1U8F7H5_CAPAN|nr:uncharacterized protein LOC107851606 [Capsicum annuum]KAF3629033.1 putative AP-1 complex subunit mu-2-like [Capsicum annuum]KAF3647178.1 putative AP-1 complex subunit mu-2-like [Capsicum annuum]PHT63295.1 hypothetical protein T459_32872 [Capsicum annuum]
MNLVATQNFKTSIQIQIQIQIQSSLQFHLLPCSPPTIFKIHNNLSNPITLKFHKTQATNHKNKITPTTQEEEEEENDNGIPVEHVKTLVKFKSRYNYIRVLEVSRKADHPLSGSRLLLLDAPGNIHSISFLFKSITKAYYDVLATLPPILPPGPLGILGFGAGSVAKLILEIYPHGVIHGYELDSAVISVAREYFGLSKVEKKYQDRLFIYISNALNASVRDGYSGLIVDMFSEGCLIPELQDPKTWENLRRKLKKGGKIMVNVGGSCVEPEDIRKDGKVIMEETLVAMNKVFEGQVYVLNLGNRKVEDSTVAIAGELPDLEKWRMSLPKPLRFYVDMWNKYCG